jgi:hypothetical protein
MSSTLINNLGNIAQWGTLVAIIIYGISQWLSGRSNAKSADMLDAERTIKLIKERADALELKLKQQDEDNKKIQQEQNNQIIRLEERVKHLDGLNKQYVEILQDRDPELKEFMKNMSTAVDFFKAYVIENSRRTEGMLTSMDKIFELNKTALAK